VSNYLPAHGSDYLMSEIRKIEIWTDSTERALLKAALNDLLDKVMENKDYYGVAENVNNLLTHLKENN
jgi:hypothetical protein